MPLDVDGLAETVALTIKAALAPLQERIAAQDARLALLGDVRDRVLAVETKAVPPPAPAVDLVPLTERLMVLESQTAALVAVSATLSDVSKDVGSLRERAAVLETRAPVAGPAGKDGADGKDGLDGMGFDDLSVEHDGERSFTIKMTRGDRVKEAGTFTLPIDIYRGVWVERTYERGDGVTWAGSEWHCRETTTTKPGDGSKAWTLKVKRGRDGRDGKDAPTIPVVRV